LAAFFPGGVLRNLIAVWQRPGFRSSGPQEGKVFHLGLVRKRQPEAKTVV